MPREDFLSTGVLDLISDGATPTHQRDNPFYSADRARLHGYEDGRWQSGHRRPGIGAAGGNDANYDIGFALGVLDRFELDTPGQLHIACFAAAFTTPAELRNMLVKEGVLVG